MRPELIHPMIVHFPLALLLVGTVLRFLALGLRSHRYLLLISSWILLGLGTCLAWAAVAAGEIAEDVVRDSLCNASVLDFHMRLAYLASYLFSFGIVFDLVMAWSLKQRFYWKTWPLTTLCVICYAGGAVILLVVGALGGNLVYEQGAAVKQKCVTADGS